MAHLLATRKSYRKFLKKTNIVINPMENVDRMVILEEMLKLTPTDKLHAGRYNGADHEYYMEYLNPKTPFGEAKVKPHIWERWLPIATDFRKGTQCLPIQKRVHRTNYSYRYPHITTIDFIREVADEIVQGDLLKVCISVHLQSNPSLGY